MSPERARSSPRPDLFDEERAVVAGRSRRRGVWIVLLVVGVGALAGGAAGWFATSDRPSAALPVPSTVATSAVETTAATSTVAPTTAAPETTAAPSTTAVPARDAPTTTVAAAPPDTAAPLNPEGVVIGKAADANSFNSAERWAATLGTSQAEAALSSKAALYTRWFRMAIGAPVSAVSTPRGFRVTFADGSVNDLVDLVAAGGKVADLTECPGGEATGTCQRVGEFVDLAALEPAGSSTSASVAWFGRVRLRGANWTLYSITTTKPVASVSAPYTATYDGATLMITGAPAGQPNGVEMTVTFTDGTAELVAVAV